MFSVLFLSLTMHHARVDSACLVTVVHPHIFYTHTLSFSTLSLTKDTEHSLTNPAAARPWRGEQR